VLPDTVFKSDQDGALIQAELFGKKGRRIHRARLQATVGGKRTILKEKKGIYIGYIKRMKSWRRYANALNITARKNGKVIAGTDTVLYASGSPRTLKAPHGKKPPQFIVLGIDDCKSLGGLENMLDITETLHYKNSRAVWTMYTAPCPGRSEDLEKQVALYQRLYDLGCEFANHTLNHNPQGINWYGHPRRVQIQEIDGCRQWLRDHIHGLWYVYSQKTGGGGARGFKDPAFTRKLMKSQRFEYNANNVTAMFESMIPHPDVQFWPYKLGDMWMIDVGLIDGNAPGVHKPITKGFYTDYSGKFDYETPDGIAMLKGNFEYRYRLPHRPPLIINAVHEWGLGQYYNSHRNQHAILKGFLLDVLVKNRKKYPNTYVITLHELIEYMQRGDIRTIIEEGKGQSKK
jgi:peptidoglycan/xylan/chitin deacetylase (PgdA/CDA1 family)